jgi:predicted Zn finger-like uncharacterized protein
MIEIQCTSCNTRYRIDERVLPDDTPTFKCSRCGHVFNAAPVPARVRKPAPPANEGESQAVRTLRPARPRAGALKSQVESDIVRREHVEESKPARVPAPPPARVEQPPPDPVPREAREPAASAIPKALQPQPGPPPSSGPPDLDADHPLNRSFGDREQKADTGENLKFDFSDERIDVGAPPPEEELERPEPDDSWQVGDTPAEFESAPVRQPPRLIAEPEPAPRPLPTPVHRIPAPLHAPPPRFAEPAAKSAGFQLGHANDESPDSAAPGRTHSSGYFLAMFFFVAVAFVAASALISDEPAASVRILSQAPRIGAYFAQPIVPAMLVALHDVHSEYRSLKGGHIALVITGSARNVGTRPLHLVEIDADLIGAGAHSIANQSVYCGNELSAKMLGEMTPREIEFSQGLSPQKAFAMEPAASAPFLMVFINPPAGADKIRVSVSRAVATATPPASDAPSRTRTGGA